MGLETSASAQLRKSASSFILLNMANDDVVRWEPASGLPERPAEIIDLGWQGSEQRLIATVRYATNLGEDDGTVSAVMIFDNVFCFKLLEENMDSSEALLSPAAQLKELYPYGGRWPFLEINSSAWIAELATCHGVWLADEFRHLVITSETCTCMSLAGGVRRQLTTGQSSSTQGLLPTSSKH